MGGDSRFTMPEHVRICSYSQTDVTSPSQCVACGARLQHGDMMPVVHILNTDQLICTPCAIAIADLVKKAVAII